MKRRIESRLEWDITHFGPHRGLATDLLTIKDDKNPEPLRVVKVVVRSMQGKFAITGHMRVDLDREYEQRVDGGFSQTSLALMKLSSRLHHDQVMGGQMGLGGGCGFTMEFSLPARSSGFCEESIRRVLIVLEHLGVKREDVPAPQITQSTFVWVPKTHPLRNHHYSNWGWIEYGTYLGDLQGLSSRPRPKAQAS